jgi:hypothetical protein
MNTASGKLICHKQKLSERSIVYVVFVYFSFLEVADLGRDINKLHVSPTHSSFYFRHRSADVLVTFWDD